MKKVIIIVLVALCAVGWVSLVFGKVSDSSEKNSYIEQADIYNERGLYQRAIASYELALAEKDSLEIYEKIADCYDKRYEEAPEDTLDNYISFLEKATNLYPKNEKFVEALANLYYFDSDFENMYNCLTKAVENGCNNEKIHALIQKAKYSFKLKSANFLSLNQSLGDYFAVQRTSYWNLYHSADGYVWSSEYSYVGIPNADGVAVAVGEKDSRIIDGTGMTLGIFEKEVIKAGVLSEGLMPVCVGGSYGYYNDMGEFQFGDYEEAGMFQNGLAVVKKDGKWMLVNKKGEIKSDAYEEIVVDYAGRYLVNEVALVKLDSKTYSICDEKLNRIVDVSCSDIDIVTEDGMIAFCQNKLWGFIDTKGEVIIEPSYENAKSFSNGMAAVCQNGLWGFINKDNKLVIEYQFTDAMYMNSNGICIVRTDDIYDEPEVKEATTETTVPQSTLPEITEKVEGSSVSAESVTKEETTTVVTVDTTTTSVVNKIESAESWQILSLNLGIVED